MISKLINCFTSKISWFKEQKVVKDVEEEAVLLLLRAFYVKDFFGCDAILLGNYGL